jgi:hypothetical protein
MSVSQKPRWATAALLRKFGPPNPAALSLVRLALKLAHSSMIAFPYPFAILQFSKRLPAARLSARGIFTIIYLLFLEIYTIF